MSADIRSLPREHIERFAPDPNVVEHCYALLQAAKEGRLRGIAYATVSHDGLTEAALAASGFVSPVQFGVFAMSHAIGMLTRRWGQYCDEGAP